MTEILLSIVIFWQHLASICVKPIDKLLEHSVVHYFCSGPVTFAEFFFLFFCFVLTNSILLQEISIQAEWQALMRCRKRGIRLWISVNFECKKLKKYTHQNDNRSD